MPYDYDLFVIGGGSGGVRAANRTAALGKKKYSDLEACDEKINEKIHIQTVWTVLRFLPPILITPALRAAGPAVFVPRHQIINFVKKSPPPPPHPHLAFPPRVVVVVVVVAAVFCACVCACVCERER